MKHYVTKIISGGQNGVDQAALRAAKALGIETGGWMPRGWKTLDGPRPEFAARYGMRECPLPGYPPRTRMNVALGDATMSIAWDHTSPGERCTAKAIDYTRKPYIQIAVLKNKGGGYRADYASTPEIAREWLLKHRVKVLNVAGNSEKTAPGIGEWAEQFLLEILG